MKKLITIKNILKTLRVLFIILFILSWSFAFIAPASDNIRLFATHYVNDSAISNMTDITGRKLNDGRDVALMFSFFPLMLGLFFFNDSRKNI